MGGALAEQPAVLFRGAYQHMQGAGSARNCQGLHITAAEQRNQDVIPQNQFSFARLLEYQHLHTLDGVGLVNNRPTSD